MRIRARIITKNYELEERRKQKQLTQIDLADIIGITACRYQFIEQMKIKPTEEEAISLALELETDADTLFPKGYEKIVDIFKKPIEQVSDYVAPLLDDGDDYKRLVEKTDATVTVEKLLSASNLSDRELELLKYRHGIDGQGGRTLEETAKKLGVTRERIRQMESKAFEKMRQSKARATCG